MTWIIVYFIIAVILGAIMLVHNSQFEAKHTSEILFLAIFWPILLAEWLWFYIGDLRAEIAKNHKQKIGGANE